MHKDERDILEVLKAELAFLEKGGYSRSPRESWRQPLIFEDSPSCANYGLANHPVPCSECVLFQLVPPQFRGKQVPCRYIPFNAAGENLDSLFHYGDQFEVEKVFGTWLHKTIATIENERQASGAEGNPPALVGGVQPAGAPLSHKLHPKCANPACATSFRWLGGGKFFRFTPDSVSRTDGNHQGPSPLGVAGVEHFWLCERCSHIFTLAFEEDRGVMLKLRYPELMEAEHPKQRISG